MSTDLNIYRCKSVGLSSVPSIKCFPILVNDKYHSERRSKSTDSTKCYSRHSSICHQAIWVVSTWIISITSKWVRNTLFILTSVFVRHTVSCKCINIFSEYESHWQEKLNDPLNPLKTSRKRKWVCSIVTYILIITLNST